MAPDYKILLEIVDELSKDTIFECIHERVSDYTSMEESSIVFSGIVQELVADEIMEILSHIQIDQVFYDLVDELTKEFIWSNASRLSRSLGKQLILYRPSKPNSKAITAKVEKLMDEMILEELLICLCGSSLEESYAQDIEIEIMRSLLSLI